MLSFVCQKCGHQNPEDRLRCPCCGGFLTFRTNDVAVVREEIVQMPARAGEEPVRPGEYGPSPHGYGSPFETQDPQDADEEETDEEVSVAELVVDTSEIEVVPIDEVDVEDDERIALGIDNADEVLGGGVPVVGASYMVSGSPGVGKSTMLLEWIYALSAQGCRVAYDSIEMQPSLVALYAKRLGLAKRYKCKKQDRPLIFQSSDPDQALTILDEHDIDVAVFDSISAMRSPLSTGPIGGASQMSYACERIVKRVQKKDGFEGRKPINIFSIVHETKDGSSAGPQAVKHWFDAALALDHIDPMDLKPLSDQTDPSGFVRLRSPGKNRWSSTSVRAYYVMATKGLQPFDPEDRPAPALPSKSPSKSRKAPKVSARKIDHRKKPHRENLRLAG